MRGKWIQNIDSPKLETNYLVRDNLIDLSKQYFFYGFYKPLVFKKFPWRKILQFVPAIHLSYLFYLYLYSHIIYFPILFYLLFNICFNVLSKNKHDLRMFFTVLLVFLLFISAMELDLSGYFNRVKIFFPKWFHLL